MAWVRVHDFSFLTIVVGLFARAPRVPDTGVIRYVPHIIVHTFSTNVLTVRIAETAMVAPGNDNKQITILPVKSNQTTVLPIKHKITPS